nr:DUF3558 domain-containing protein [Nocardia panacis]
MCHATALALGAVLAIAGCGRSTDGNPSASSGQPSTSTPMTSAGLGATSSPNQQTGRWDPCTSIPNDALRASGLNPDDKEPNVAGVDFTGWKACTWGSTARWHYLAILSGEPTLDQIRQRRDFGNFSPMTVAGRPATRFGFSDDADGLDCGVAVEIPQGPAKGSVAFLITTRLSVGKQGNPCTEATRYANDLAKYLPGGGN